MELGWAKQQVLTRSSASSSTTCQLSERRESLEKVREENKKTVVFLDIFYLLLLLPFYYCPQVPGKTTHPLHRKPTLPQHTSFTFLSSRQKTAVGRNWSSILFCTFSTFFFLSSPFVFFFLFGSIFTCDDQTWTSGGSYTTRSLTHQRLGYIYRNFSLVLFILFFVNNHIRSLESYFRSCDFRWVISFHVKVSSCECHSPNVCPSWHHQSTIALDIQTCCMVHET